jgi:hypothetical protein
MPLFTRIIDLSTNLDFFTQLPNGFAQVLSKNIIERNFGHVRLTTEWHFRRFCIFPGFKISVTLYANICWLCVSGRQKNQPSTGWVVQMQACSRLEQGDPDSITGISLSRKGFRAF